VKHVLFSVERSPGDAWTERKGRAVYSGYPTFRKTEGENEYIHFLNCSPDCGKMLLPICDELLDARETLGLDPWSKGINNPSIFAPPHILGRNEKTVGTLQ
jgi:hypothetical protein